MRHGFKIFFIATCVLLIGMLNVSCGAFSKAYDTAAFVMDTIVSQHWVGDNAKKAAEEIEKKLKDIENELSLYIDESVVSKVNAVAGKEYINVSNEIYTLMERSKGFCEEAGGVFDITIAPLSLLWGITGENPKVPNAEKIEAALSKVDYRKLLLDEDTNSVMLADEGMKLDLGAVAKGYATDVIRPIVEENDVSGYISIGGNMLVIGKEQDGSDIVVGLRDPLGDADDYFATVVMDGYTMATSATCERYFVEDGVKYHHILDSRTGYPSESDLLSVTVMSKDGMTADALSTSIFLQGTEGLTRYFDREDCFVLAITKNKEIIASEAFLDRLTMVDGVEYRIVSHTKEVDG